MATVRELVEIVAEATGEPLSSTKLIARALQDEGLLPLAQGRRVPHVTGNDVAMLLFALYGAETIRGAPDAARRYAGLALRGRDAPPGAPESVRKRIDAEPCVGDVLGGILDSLMEGLPHDLRVGEGEAAVQARLSFLELVQSWPEVNLTFHLGEDRREEVARYVERGKNANFWQSDRPRRAVTIPLVCLVLIANRLSECAA